MTISVQLHNVTKVLKRRKLLQNISVQWTSDDIIGIYGPNGSGKTMLLRLVCQLIAPTTGDVTYVKDERTVSFQQLTWGVTLEAPRFWLHYTGRETLRILASLTGKIGEEEISAALTEVGLATMADCPVKEYSLGMRQKLALAQALMEQPDIIVLDEPTNALDDQAIELVERLLQREQRRGALVIVVSHDRMLLQRLATRQFQMSEGCLSEVVVQ